MKKTQINTFNSLINSIMNSNKEVIILNRGINPEYRLLNKIENALNVVYSNVSIILTPYYNMGNRLYQKADITKSNAFIFTETRTNKIGATINQIQDIIDKLGSDTKIIIDVTTADMTRTSATEKYLDDLGISYDDFSFTPVDFKPTVGIAI